jgi:hypothetical protein
LFGQIETLNYGGIETMFQLPQQRRKNSNGFGNRAGMHSGISRYMTIHRSSSSQARTHVLEQKLSETPDPYESKLPDQITVKLKAGELAFYNNNILHRGVYDSTKERMTLHGSIGTKAAGKQRARNVLQHGVGEWAGKWNLEGEKGEWVGRAKAMRDRLVSLGNESGDVGYFAEDE